MNQNHWDSKLIPYFQYLLETLLNNYELDSPETKIKKLNYIYYLKNIYYKLNYHFIVDTFVVIFMLEYIRVTSEMYGTLTASEQSGPKGRK